MNSSCILVVMLLLMAGVALPGQAFAGGAETMAEEKETEETARPRSPLRVRTVDFQDAGEGSGKLRLAGIALPGRELHLFLDDKPFATVVPDDSGKWSFEGAMTLGDGRHTLRADQYVEGAEIPAARAIVTLQRVAPKSGDAPAPKATSP